MVRSLGQSRQLSVAIYLAYVSATDHTLVDMRLYLPQEWAKDKARLTSWPAPRRGGYRSRTNWRCRCCRNEARRCRIGGSPAMTRWAARTGFAAGFEQLAELYLLAVPSTTLIRDLESAPPADRGHGRRPQRPLQRSINGALRCRQTPGRRLMSAMAPKAVGGRPGQTTGGCACAQAPRRPAETLLVSRYRERDSQKVRESGLLPVQCRAGDAVVGLCPSL